MLKTEAAKLIGSLVTGYSPSWGLYYGTLTEVKGKPWRGTIEVKGMLQFPTQGMGRSGWTNRKPFAEGSIKEFGHANIEPYSDEPLDYLASVRRVIQYDLERYRKTWQEYADGKIPGKYVAFIPRTIASMEIWEIFYHVSLELQPEGETCFLHYWGERSLRQKFISWEHPNALTSEGDKATTLEIPRESVEWETTKLRSRTYRNWLADCLEPERVGKPVLLADIAKHERYFCKNLPT